MVAIILFMSMAHAEPKLDPKKVSPKVCHNHHKYLDPKQQKMVDDAKKAAGCK